MTMLSFAACDDDHKPDWNDPAPFDTNIISMSITDGETVPVSTNAFVVTYDNDIAVNSLATVTINGNPVDSLKVVDNTTLAAYFSLAKGKSYTLNIPANTVTAIGSKTFAPEVTVTFSTPRPDALINKSLVANSLTNANATAEAKAVYKLLLDNYGSRQLSGSMGEVAWGTGFYDLVSNAAGKKPAIIGFDYIHLAYSPANWIDYGDITPVKSAWEAGSIPAMTWHWNVPTSEGGLPDSFNAQNDQFKASNVLVDGTWENSVALADVEKLAGYLTLLQDAGIPVLWRPFHEAAGDYTWGAWFWWGNSGVDTTKQLWAWLHDKLTNEYGLNNLIWVWTVQTSDAGNIASISKMKEAYPGDELVDIVGTDLYVDSYSNQFDQFEAVYNTVDGKKIVALTECGNLIEVDNALAEGALWSYFMGWYEQDSNGPAFIDWNTADEWQTILNNPIVLNRGDLNF